MNRAAGVLELMDSPVDATEELERNFADIAFANRWLGGFAPLRREVHRLDARSVLDVGCGRADLPLRLVSDAARRGIDLHVTCLDHSEQILALARRRTGNDPRLTFVRAEGAQLPFGDASFDVVTCTLTLHHFEPDAAIALLRELRRVARTAPVVIDLRRSVVALAATLLYAWVCARSPITRHDAPLSVRRAYSPAETLALARAAGWSAPHVRGEAFFRMTLLDG